MAQVPDVRARALLSRWTASPSILGQGMEGIVYGLDDGRVAKVWSAASVGRLQVLQRFYADLVRRRFGFGTPVIEEIVEVDGSVVTLERRLPGTELSTAGGVDAQAVIVDVLAELAGAGTLPLARSLPVIGGDNPFGDDDFPIALAALATRRVARFRGLLTAAVDELDAKLAALPARVADVDSRVRTVVHGDLIPANVLVDDAGRPSAVLDWGFLTTEGDPVFDAAVAAATFDMYGAAAAATERRLQDRLVERLGYDRTALLVYRAAYSAITANVYDAFGRDGHFAWCVQGLNRPDVTAALLD